MAFLSDITTHLQNYAHAHQVDSQAVHVRLTFADGSSLLVRGLSVFDPPVAQGWGMIRGTASAESDAVIIREGHIIKAEFQLAPAERKPIGFQSETV